MLSSKILTDFVGYFVDPARILAISPLEQSKLIRLSRLAAVLGVLAHRIDDAGLFSQCAPQLQDHLAAGKVVARDYERQLRFEINELNSALRSLDLPLVYLKGAAYELRGLPIARGRVASDVDVLVPEHTLVEVEQTLLRSGWVAEKSDEYDQRYYREWMHELPPLRHRRRLSVIDLHHNILPRTSRCFIDPHLLLSRIDHIADVYTLSAEDMVLHNCVHLFIDGDLNNRVRELIDLDGLLRTFCSDPEFIERLVTRANELGLQTALFYGLRFARDIPDTPVSPAAFEFVANAMPPAPHRRILLAMMEKAMLPELLEEGTFTRRFSIQFLYLRSHWLRMPFGLLVRHLWHQARRRGGLKTAESTNAGV